MRKCPRCGSTLTEKENTGDQIMEGIAKFGGLIIGTLIGRQDLAKGLCTGPLQNSKYRCIKCGTVFGG